MGEPVAEQDMKTHKNRVWVSATRRKDRASEPASPMTDSVSRRPRKPIIVLSSLIAAAASGGQDWIASVPQEVAWAGWCPSTEQNRVESPPWDAGRDPEYHLGGWVDTPTGPAFSWVVEKCWRVSAEEG
eukprot:5328903-Alexandrium_andersonii.AAC.1